MREPTVTNETLIAYAAGEVKGDARRDVEAFIRTNPDAARRVAVYRLAAETFAADDTVAPPENTVARAKAIFREMISRNEIGWLERLEAIIAHLVYDSRVQPAAVRRRGAGDSFQLTFETDHADIDLRAERVAGDTITGGRWRVMGQVDAAAPAVNFEVTIVPADGAGSPVRIRSDDHAIFAVDVDPGAYDVRIALPDALVVLPNVEIR